MTNEIKPDDVAVIEQESLSVLAEADKLKIRNESEYLAAVAFVKEVIKPMIGKYEGFYDKTIKFMHAEHKRLVAEKNSHVQPLEKARAGIDMMIAHYSTKKKLEAERESARLMAAQRKQLEEQIELERAQRAQELMDKGDEDGAVAAMDEEIEIPDSVLPPAIKVKADIPSGTGVSIRQNYNIEVVDVYKLIEAVKKGIAPMNVLAANETFLKAMARQLKDKGRFEEAYPGVKCVVTESVGVRD